MLRRLFRRLHGIGARIPALVFDRAGVTAIEFAIVAPVLLAIGIGMLKFGVAMQQYLAVTNAAAQGALTMGLARGTTTPYTSMTTAITTAAPTLVSGSITKTATVNGTACTTDTGCATALVAGATVTVTVSYPCDLTVMGVNFKSSCSLSSTSGQMVQ